MRDAGDLLPAGLTPINVDAGVYRFEEAGSSRDANDTIHFTVYGDGSIDIQSVEMVGITIEALEYITSLARANRKAAFNEDS